MKDSEELLKPRYKVIADYPGSNFKLSEVLLLFPGSIDWLRSNRPPMYQTIPISEAKSYPHIFKKLEWYEERRIDELPKYVKVTNTLFRCNNDNLGKVLKINEWKPTGADFKFFMADNYHVNHLSPATEEEFNSQQK